MIKKFISKLFGIKQCACPEEDEHIEYYTKVPEPDIMVLENENVLKKEHCDSHLRFRKSCPKCQEIVA